MMSLLTWLSDLIYRHRQRGDLRFDSRLGLDTCEIDLKPDAGRLPGNIRSHALHYAPTPIPQFRRFVRRSGVNPRNFAFVDLGAGKGRTLLLASSLGFDSVTGFEIDPRLCRIAAENIRKWGNRGGVVPKVIQGDARKATFPPGHLFVFLFNPFTGPIFESVAARLARIARQQGRAVVIAYHNDSCSSALERTGAFRRARLRPLQFWRPPTVSFFYNEEAWGMRKLGSRVLLPRRLSAR